MVAAMRSSQENQELSAMSTTRFQLLLAIQAFCVVGAIVVGVMILKVNAHPLSTGEIWTPWLLYVLPYFLLSGAGALSIQRSGMLMMISVLTALNALILSAACYQNMEISLSLLDAQAAGRRGMS